MLICRGFNYRGLWRKDRGKLARMTIMRTVKFIPVVAVALTVSGCGDSEWFGGIFGGDGSEAGLPYRASLARTEEPRSFAVRVTAGEATVDDVRESARMPATRYCLETYGGSDVDWDMDSASGDWEFARDGEFMVFSGRCTTR